MKSFVEKASAPKATLKKDVVIDPRTGGASSPYSTFDKPGSRRSGRGRSSGQTAAQKAAAESKRQEKAAADKARADAERARIDKQLGGKGTAGDDFISNGSTRTAQSMDAAGAHCSNLLMGNGSSAGMGDDKVSAASRNCSDKMQEVGSKISDMLF